MSLRPSSAPSVNRGVNRAVNSLVSHEPGLLTRPALSEPPGDYAAWLDWLFPGGKPLGDHHHEFWQWVASIRANEPADPFVSILPRGGAKSTNAERACAYVGALATRRYVLYFSETQRQADKHVQAVASILERKLVGEYYPALGERAVSKFGHSKGWRGNRIRTASGLTVDALGFDAAVRGAKVDEDRPDLIILDDIDGKLDTPATTAKKIDVITTNILPSQAAHGTVLCVQNVIIPNGVFAQLADGRAEWLATRVVSGPHPALRDFAYESRVDERGRQRFIIVAGLPVWAGQDVAACQRYIDTWGISAFLSECQHLTEPPAGGLFSHLVYQHCAWSELPRLVRTVVWCDPAVTDTDQSDANGIQADGVATNGTIYRLWSYEQRSTPLATLKRALSKAVELGADHVGIETDQGGDTWKSVYDEAWRSLLADGAVEATTRRPPMKSAKAGAGHGPKTHRASQMLTDYERGKIVHVMGTHETLEKSLRRFPKSKPFDLVDAAYWSWYHLAKPVKVVRDYRSGEED